MPKSLGLILAKSIFAKTTSLSPLNFIEAVLNIGNSFLQATSYLENQEKNLLIDFLKLTAPSFTGIEQNDGMHIFPLRKCVIIVLVQIKNVG